MEDMFDTPGVKLGTGGATVEEEDLLWYTQVSPRVCV